MSKEISVTISDVTQKKWTFTNLKELTSFISHEIEYWQEKHSDIANQRARHPYYNALALLNQGIKTLEQWENHIDSWDDATIARETSNLTGNIWRPIPGQWLWSGHPFTSKFTDIHRDRGGVSAGAFIGFVVQKQNCDTNTYEGFIGAALAYEFINQDSDLPKRRTAEKKSISQLRNILDTTTSELIKSTDEFKTSYTEWAEAQKGDWNQWREDCDQAHNNKLAEQRDTFSDYMDICKARISDMETLYQEKLRLEKPAEYWRKAARRYGIQGGLWSITLILSVLLGLIYFHDFFTSWLQGRAVDIKLNTLQGVVIFGSIVAIFAFLTRTLARLTFSSFHLMRDAEEREQLTYLYLALNEETGIDEVSRNIILQALFSRTDTGLLSSDSGPTMPGLSEAIKTTEKLR